MTVCANAVDDSTGRPLFDRIRIVDLQGRRVAVTAVIGVCAFHTIPADQRAGHRVTDPATVLRELMLEHHHHVDAWMVLSHSGFETDLELAALKEEIAFTGRMLAARLGTVNEPYRDTELDRHRLLQGRHQISLGNLPGGVCISLSGSRKRGHTAFAGVLRQGDVLMARRTAAVCAISLGVVVAAAACGPEHRVAAQPTTGPSRTTAPTVEPSQTTVSPSASAGVRPGAACGTKELRWRLTRLADKSSKAPTALLSATNTSTASCAFNGYPELHAYAGKGPAVWSEPKAKAPVRLMLGPGNSVDFPLFYPASPAPNGSCSIPVDDDPRIEVLPPHRAPTDYGATVQITDLHGRNVTPVFCDTVHLGAPRLR
jgi:hypothetical protein